MTDVFTKRCFDKTVERIKNDKTQYVTMTLINSKGNIVYHGPVAIRNNKNET